MKRQRNYLYLGPGRISFAVRGGRVTQLRGSPPPLEPTVEWLESMAKSEGWRRVYDDPRFAGALKSLLYSPVGVVYANDFPTEGETAARREWWSRRLSVPVDLILDWELGIDRPTKEQRVTLLAALGELYAPREGGKCAKCGREGPDLGTVTMSCGHDMGELGLPLEAGDEPYSYQMRVCKSCRADWMRAITDWFWMRPKQEEVPLPGTMSARAGGAGGMMTMTQAEWEKLGRKDDEQEGQE